MDPEHGTDSDVSEYNHASDLKGQVTTGSDTRELKSEPQQGDNDGSETNSRIGTCTTATLETGTRSQSGTPVSNLTGTSMRQSVEEQQSKNVSSNSSSSARNKQTITPMETNTHRVTFTVTISKAIPTGSLSCLSDSSHCSTVEDDLTTDGTETKRRRRIVEAPRAQNHFHFEYNLLPLDDEVVKTDVVTYGIAAKIYTERQDPKVLKTWTDKDLTWVAWTHAHTVSITDELLTKLFNHELQLRVWDTRDKLSTRARYDRPKAFKLPPIKSGDDGGGGGVKPIVLKQVASYESLQPKKSYIDRPLPTQTQAKTNNTKTYSRGPQLPGAASSDDILNQGRDDGASSSELRGHRPQSPTPTTLVQVPVHSKKGVNTKSFSRLGKLAGVPPPDELQPGRAPGSGHRAAKSKVKRSGKASPGVSSAENMVDANNAQDEPVQGDNDRKGSASSQAQPGPAQDMQKVRRSKKQEAAAQARAERVKKYGICCISIQMAKLFAGLDTVTERLEKPVNGLEDVFITVSLSGPLMSESQHRKLNPLVVKVTSATDMPEKPLPFDELRLRCMPAYVKYKLFDLPVHRSVGREQERHIYWNDIHVVLAGIMEPSVLREYLHGPPVEIEVHDRDRIKEKHKLKPTLFGDDLEDEKISNVGTISSKRTLHNPFLGKDQPWDPYGVAKLDMSGLLLGQKVMHLKIPIHQCDIPDVLGMQENWQDNRLIGISGAVDGPESSPLPPGHYIQSGSCLKVKVEVAYPLVTPTQLAAKVDVEPTKECPFARIVYKFDYKNVMFLIRLESLITEINATTLGLGKMPAHVIKSALSTYKLTMEQQRCHYLNLITGFHLLDGEMHLFVLEGLAQQGIRRIWETIGKPEDPDVQVLYHSHMAFKNRLYGILDVNFSGIKLHEPLTVIACQPLLYVRDMVPKPCFQAILRLNQLSQTTKLRAAVRNNLFPTVNMVISMSKEFGVPMTEEDFQELTPQPPPVKEQRVIEIDDMPHPSRVWTPIDNYNANYVEKLHNRARTGSIINYTTENKAAVHERSIVNSIERSKSCPMTIKVPASPAHNYSSQALNSTEQAREALRNILPEAHDVLYTYCPEYHHSMTFVPVNLKALKLSEEKASRDAWKTSDGWIYPGKKTMLESNKHPRRLDEARVEDLHQPWEELSRLPKGATIPRSCYPWGHRHGDMDTWTRPLPVFGVNEPVTIHEAGERLKQEHLEAMREEAAVWHSKLVVNDPRTYIHRCATETELTEAGFKSSNQIERLKGLRKDPPMKYTLRKHGMALKEIPPLNVVQNPSVDTESRLAGIDLRPAIEDEFDQKVKGFVPGEDNYASILLDSNQIPVYDYQHDQFIAERGQDFNFYHKERSNLHKRPIKLMTEEEYRLHLFRLPSPYQSLTRYYTLPDLETFNEQVSDDFLSQKENQTVRQAAVETN